MTAPASAPGYDLVGAFTGSEGTLGIVTKIVVRLTRIPQVITTLLACFRSTGAGGAAVSAIIGAGILPAAIEMMDALAIEAAEAAVACNYPAGARGGAGGRAGHGPAADVRRDVAAVRALCKEAGRDRDPGRGHDLACRHLCAAVLPRRPGAASCLPHACALAPSVLAASCRAADAW